MSKITKNVEETGARSRENRRYSQGRVVGVNTLTNLATIDVGANLLDGTPVLLGNVPFNPQTPPLVGSLVALDYFGTSPHGVRIIAGGTGGPNAPGSQTINAGNVVNSLRGPGESAPGQVGDLQLESDGVVILITRSGKVFTFSSPELTAALNSSLFGAYTSLDARLEAIEEMLISCGCTDTFVWSYDFSKGRNSFYLPA